MAARPLTRIQLHALALWNPANRTVVLAGQASCEHEPCTAAMCWRAQWAALPLPMRPPAQSRRGRLNGLQSHPGTTKHVALDYLIRPVGEACKDSLGAETLPGARVVAERRQLGKKKIVSRREGPYRQKNRAMKGEEERKAEQKQREPAFG